MSRADHPSMNAEINVTPFLDVLLVLIITFMAALQARKAMDVQLPVPCTGTCSTTSDAIVLEVLGADRFLLNRQPIHNGQLLATLASTFAGRPDKILQVAGHDRARYQEVLFAMDVARTAGVRVLSVPSSETYDRR
jgi:biopolymer transport protein ExbD